MLLFLLLPRILCCDEYREQSIMMMRALFIFLTVNALSAATTYFVRTDGDDTHSGTANISGAAWKTIQKAAATMVAGDTVEVQAGTFPEIVKISASGTSGHPITFRGGGVAVCHGFYVKASYITIDGFDMPYNTAKADWEGVIEVYRGLAGLTIINNKIHDWNPIGHNTYGIHFNYASNAAVACRDVFVSNNVLRNLSYVMLSINASNYLVVSNVFDFANSHDAIHAWGADGIFRQNYFTNISENPSVKDHTDIIQTFGEDPVEAYRITFEQNVVVNCEAQIGQLEQGPDRNRWRNIGDWTFRNNVYARVGMQMNCDLPRTKIQNNTFYRCTTNTGHVLQMGYNRKGFATNCEIKNNLFVECGENPANKQFGWYSNDGGASANLTADYNLVTGSRGATKQVAPPNDLFHWKAWRTEAHGINGGSVLFVNAVGLDFRLQSGSRGVDAGTTIESFSDDVSGATRTGIWEMGAHDRGNGASPEATIKPAQ